MGVFHVATRLSYKKCKQIGFVVKSLFITHVILCCSAAV